MTLLFFPDWANGLPSDFLILHFIKNFQVNDFFVSNFL